MKPGDKVAYGWQFLESIGMSHSDMSHARGEIVELIPLHSTTLARVKWNCDMPEKVNVKNLAIVGPNMKFCKC